MWMRELSHQVREIRIAFYKFSDEPTLRYDLQAQFANLFKRAFNETAANTAASKRYWHLGMEDRHHASSQPIICDGNPSTGIQLEPLLFGVVAYRCHRSGLSLAALSTSCRRRAAVIGGMRAYALPQHFLQGRGAPVLLQEVAKRFLREFLDGGHPILRKPVEREPRVGIELDAPANAA